MSMDMIRGKEKNIIISREEKHTHIHIDRRFICFPFRRREKKKKFVST